MTGASQERLRAQVRVACGRIAGVAAAIVDAHSLGVPEGPHGKPWTMEYHREAGEVYAESLPPWYRHDIAELFSRCAKTMAEHSIPARLAEDWVIVGDYLTLARSAIIEWLESVDREPGARHPVPVDALEDRETPLLVIRFDALARLTTTEGALRLQRAALAVRQQMESPAPEVLAERDLMLLKRLSGGAAIADIAEEMGYSQRSVYRAMASLWKALGVPGRKEGVRKATAEGLI